MVVDHPASTHVRIHVGYRAQCSIPCMPDRLDIDVVNLVSKSDTNILVPLVRISKKAMSP